MAIEKIDISKFLTMAGKPVIAVHGRDSGVHNPWATPVIDVRSPAEFEHAHIPGAISFPLFNNEERAVVGTAYKQQSREQAIKIGLDYFGVKMKRMVEEAEKLKTKSLVVHCWRGGMRSAAVAWLLDLYGFKVYTLTGGYKAYRRWTLECLKQDHDIRILGGFTGSGKTEVLHAMNKMGEPVIDLEELANHKGSAFGAIGQPRQPSQEMFENLLALQLQLQSGTGKQIWLEDESQRMGLLNLSQDFWQMMRLKPVYFIDVPFEQRLNYIVKHYGKLQKGDLAAAVMRIKKRLGGLETKTALNFLAEDNIAESFRILLRYYDKLYEKALTTRPVPAPVIKITAPLAGHEDTARLILANTTLIKHQS
jgi:tRNA 2-selenouridine synthase